MFIYQFMSAAHALDDLRKRRLKVSALEDMNDPFELLGGELSDSARRRGFRNWKAHMNQISRVLCFSRTWSNPVMWSHYADKHRGACLCFKAPNELLLGITYEAKRLPTQLEDDLQGGSVSSELSKKLLTTKFADWKYEDEVRLFVRPEETYEELGLRFYEFGKQLELRKVILGPRCTVPVAEVRAALHPSDVGTLVVQSRLAFKTFRVIPVVANK